MYIAPSLATILGRTGHYRRVVRVLDNGCDNLNEQGVTNTYGFYCQGGGVTWRGATVSGAGIGNFCIKNSSFQLFRANDSNACNSAGDYMADFLGLNAGTIRLDPLQ